MVIERIIHQREMEAVANQQRDNILTATRQAEESARQQREAQEKEFHNKRKQQAQTYLEESGVCSLVTKFTEVIGGDCLSYYKDLKTEMDPDSSSIDVIWDRRRVDTITTRMANGSMEYDVMKGRGFTIECRPNGDIVFHGGLFGRSRISVEKWRDNRTALESSLEKAYNHPRTVKYTDTIFGRWSPGPDYS